MDRGTRSGRSPAVAILLSVSSFVLTLLLFSPVRIFIGNFMEFTSLFQESALVFLALSLALILVLFVVLLAACRRPAAYRVAVSIACAASFLMWLQGNILRWQYGVLDGKDIPWDALMHLGFIDGAIWAACIAFAVVRADLVERASRLASLCIIVVQLLTVGWLWISMPKDQSFKRQEIPADTLFKYSDHVNVVVLVLDTFQSDFFQDIVRDEAELAACFDGFTYFRNALTGSDGTIASVPNMLTGSNYDNAVPYLEYVRAAFLGNSLPKTLTAYSFSVELSPLLDYTVFSDFSGAATPTRKLRNWEAFFGEQAFLVDLALFSSVPHFVKESIYRDQRWLVSAAVERYLDGKRGVVEAPGGGQGSAEAPELKYARELENLKVFSRLNRDPQFIFQMIRSSELMPGTDAFKFIHLKGIHLPLIMNESMGYEEMEPFRANMLRQGIGVLKIAATFLERLRQLGAYDNSLIFIVGDHGSGVADTKINVSARADTLNRTGPYKGSFSGFKAAGIPLILAKRMRATGALSVSDAPVALGDIPQTVVEELGLEAEFPGRSMFGVREGEERERIYRAFVGPQLDVEYLAPLYEYAVNGFSWDDASWRETGNVYYAPK
jgi:hypothetical protein